MTPHPRPLRSSLRVTGLLFTVLFIGGIVGGLFLGGLLLRLLDDIVLRFFNAGGIDRRLAHGAQFIILRDLADDVVHQIIHVDDLLEGERLLILADHLARLGAERGQKRNTDILADALLEKVDQPARGRAQRFTAPHIDYARRHAPIVVERLIALVVFRLQGFVKNAVENLFIILAPAPNGIDQHLALIAVDVGQAVGVAIILEELGGVLRGDIVDILLGESLGGLVRALNGRPFKIDPRARIGELCADGKGVDARDLAVDRVVADIAELAAVAERARYRAEDELSLIHTRVVGRDIAGAEVERAVHNDDVGVLHRRLDARADQARRGGEDDLTAVVDRLHDGIVGIAVERVGIGQGVDLVLKGLLDIDAPLLVLMHPARLGGRAVIDKADLQGVGHRLREDARDQALILLLGRLGLELDGLIGRLELDVLPHLAEVLLDLVGVGGDQLLIAVDLQIAEHGVAAGGRELLAAAGGIRLVKFMIRRRKGALFVDRPLLVELLTQYGLQLGVAAALCKLDEVDLAVLIERDKFVIELDLVTAVALGQDAGDDALDGVRAEEFEHADALVALEDIEAVQIFIRLDRVVDALGDVRLAQMLPLGGELAVLLEDGHEVRREGRGTSAGFGADNLLDRDGHQTEVDHRGGLVRGKKIIQHRKRGGFAVRLAALGFLLTQL